MKALMIILSLVFVSCVTAQNRDPATPPDTGCSLDGKFYPERTTYGDFMCIQGEWTRYQNLDQSDCSPARDLDCPTKSTKGSGGE